MSGFPFFSSLGAAGSNGFDNNYGNGGDNDPNGHRNNWNPVNGHGVPYLTGVDDNANNEEGTGNNPTLGSTPSKTQNRKRKAPRQNSAASKAHHQNTTDPVPGQTDWSVDNLPDILYQFRATVPRQRTYDDIPTKPSPWGDKMLRDFPILPDRISTDVEEFRVEAWMRMDRRIQLQDITDRMNPEIRVQRNALQQRGVRFRQAFKLLSWGTGGKGTADTEKEIAAALLELGIDPADNSTRGLTPGLINPALGEAGGPVPVPENYAKRYQSQSQSTQATPAPPPPPPPSSLARLPLSPPPTKRRRVSVSPDTLNFDILPQTWPRQPPEENELQPMPMSAQLRMSQARQQGYPAHHGLWQPSPETQAFNTHTTEDISESPLATQRRAGGKYLPGTREWNSGAIITLTRSNETREENAEDEDEWMQEDHKAMDDDDDFMPDGSDGDDDEDDEDFEFDQDELDEEDHEIYDNQYSNNNNQEYDDQDDGDAEIDEGMGVDDNGAEHEEGDQAAVEADNNQQDSGLDSQQEDVGYQQYDIDNQQVDGDTNEVMGGESAIDGLGTNDPNDQYATLPLDLPMPELVPDWPKFLPELAEIALGLDLPGYCNDGLQRLNNPALEEHIRRTFEQCGVPYAPDDRATMFDRMVETMGYGSHNYLNLECSDPVDQFYADTYRIFPLNSQKVPENPYPLVLPDDSFVSDSEDIFEFLEEDIYEASESA